jgi:DNA (cytosine-5)-methyltransferase 1
MNFSKAWNEGRGVMTEEQRDLFPRFTRKGELRENTKTGSRAWGRVNPKGLFPTIVVGLYASDSRVGNQLHWDDHRYLTTMEARRAQSFPDNEVLLGTPAEGWKLMGNSVARSVALSLGLSLREAWLKNGPDHELPHTKARTSLPVLNARKRSGIEVIIPTTTRRNKPESELVVASQLSSSVHNEMASGNLVNPRRRTVAPEKARRSRFELESEKSAGEEICPPIEFMDRPVSFNAARRSRVIPDSAEASADDDSISEETFHRFLGSLAPRTPNSRDGLILSGSGSDRQVKPMSLKRPHGMLRISEERVQERTRKVPRVIIPSSSSSSLPGSRSPYRQHPKAQPVSPSTLVEKLDSIRRDQIRQKRANLRDDNEDGDSTVEVIPGPSSAIQSSSLMNSARSRPTQTAGSGRSKVPSKEKPKVQVVISLLTDDEDEDPDAAGPLSRPSLSSSKNYVPADNSNLMAYAQTSRLMNHGKTKKRVLVR